MGQRTTRTIFSHHVFPIFTFHRFFSPICLLSFFSWPEGIRTRAARAQTLHCTTTTTFLEIYLVQLNWGCPWSLFFNFFVWLQRIPRIWTNVRKDILDSLIKIRSPILIKQRQRYHAIKWGYFDSLDHPVVDVFRGTGSRHSRMLHFLA